MSESPLVLRFGNRDRASGDSDIAILLCWRDGEMCSALACGLPPKCPRHVVDHALAVARKLSDASGRDVRIVCNMRNLAMGGVVR